MKIHLQKHLSELKIKGKGRQRKETLPNKGNAPGD